MMPSTTPRTRPVLDNAQPIGEVGLDELGVPCIYCRERIPAASFAFWSSTRRLMSATCPTCGRRVTLTAPTWRRWRAVSARALR
jgi:hypothetical protein